MSTGARAYDFDADEAAYDQLYQTTPITLSGRIADETGYPLKHAQVTLIAWGESSANHGATGSAQAGGFFTMPGMARRAALLRISRSGYYTELIPVDLQKPLGETSVDVGTIVLTARRIGRTRLIFAGDTMMARRYIDDDGDGIVGEPTDLIHPASAETDTIALFRYVRDMLENDDLTVVNLETAVTANPVTPHPTKSHVFYTLPDSLLAFPQVGIESVTIGNNHVYDFLEAGMFDTLAAIDAAGLDWFGAGIDETEARANRYYTSPGGVELAFQGFNELIGTNYGGPDLYIVALDNPFAKGGALALNIATITEFVDDEAPTRFAIPVMHGGTEYVFQQPGPMRDDFRLAIDRGAGFVVAHHPHYAHGVAVYDGGMGPRFIFSSLGNFVFDQGFFETARSYLAMVDIDWHPGGAQVSRVRLVPFRQDGFIPRLLVGHGLERMGRFLGHLSTQAAEPGDGITGATVFAEGGRIVALASAAEALVEEAQESRQAPVTNGFTDVIPFDPYSPGDSLAQVVAATSSTCQVGRDLLWTGDFEEEDVDAHYHEGDRWLTATSRYLQNSVVHSGSGAAVLLRLYTSPGYTALSTENTIQVTPDGTLSITGFVKGDNAGLFEIAVRQLDSNGGVVLYDTMYQRSASTYDWSRFTTTFILAPGTTSIRIDLRASPPAAGEGRVFLDDIAIVEWDAQTYDGDQGFSLATPNQWDYLRCRASGDVSTLGLDLLHRSYASR